MPLVGKKCVTRQHHEILAENLVCCYDDVVLEKIGDKSLPRGSMVSDGGYTIRQMSMAHILAVWPDRLSGGDKNLPLDLSLPPDNG